jgi:hypothetical protein
LDNKHLAPLRAAVETTVSKKLRSLMNLVTIETPEAGVTSAREVLRSLIAPKVELSSYHAPLETSITSKSRVFFGRPGPDDRRITAPAWLGGLTAFVMGAARFLIGETLVPNPVEPFWLGEISTPVSP